MKDNLFAFKGKSSYVIQYFSNFFCLYMLSSLASSFQELYFCIVNLNIPGKTAPGFGIGALEELDAEDEDVYASG